MCEYRRALCELVHVCGCTHACVRVCVHVCMRAKMYVNVLVVCVCGGGGGGGGALVGSSGYEIDPQQCR